MTKLDNATKLWLPVGTVVRVTWSGGNGPCEYVVSGHSKSGVPTLQTELDRRVGHQGMNTLDGPVGSHPLTEAFVVRWPIAQAIRAMYSMDQLRERLMDAWVARCVRGFGDVTVND